MNMENNIDFKKLWQGQKVSMPNMEEVLKKISQFKKSALRKLIFINVALVVTSLFIVFIWYKYQPQFISTKIGIVLIILAMVIYLLQYNKLFGNLSKMDSTQNSSAYLQQLTTINKKQKYLQTKILSLYFILLSVGICLYMYEYTSRMTTFWAIVAYTVTLCWVGFNWFYIRPRTIKKQQTKLDELITKLQTIDRQLKA